MSNSWYFAINSNDNPNMVPHAMHILDQEMGSHPEVSGIFYGFKHHGSGFGIEGFILFLDGKDENKIRRLLPGFGIRVFNHDNDANHFRAFVCRTSIFTKWGLAVNETSFTFEIQWQYHELEEEHHNDQEFAFAQ